MVGEASEASMPRSRGGPAELSKVLDPCALLLGCGDGQVTGIIKERSNFVRWIASILLISFWDALQYVEVTAG